MRSLLDKKGQLGSIQGIVMTLVVVGIILAVGFLVLAEFGGALDAGSVERNATDATISALENVTTFLPIIVIIAIVGVLLAIVFAVLPRSGNM